MSNHTNNLKYNSNTGVLDTIKPYNYLFEEADINDCLCFDPNSITLMSLVVCLIIDPTIIVVIPIDKRCYREFMFNKLTNVTSIQLMRLQHLSIESMLNNRNISLLNRIQSMIGYIRNTRRYLSGPMSILIELDTRITDHYHLLRNSIIVNENTNETLYYTNKEVRYLNSQSLIFKRLEEDISPVKNNLDITLHSDLTYNHNQSLIYNVIQYLAKYGFNRVIKFIYRNHSIEYDDNSLMYYGNCNDDMTLYYIRINDNKEVLNIVHHDLVYKAEYNSNTNTNITHRIRMDRWKLMLKNLVLRHLHSTNTILNVNDLLLSNNGYNNNYPPDCTFIK